MKDNWTDKLPSLMEGYQEVPPEGLWDAVQAGVASPIVPWWPWAAGLAAAAAAVVLAVFLWRPMPSAIPADAPFGLLTVPAERLADVTPAKPTPRAPKGPISCSNPAETETRAPEGPVSCSNPSEPSQSEPSQPEPVAEPQAWPEQPQPWPEPEQSARKPRRKPGRVEITVTSGGMLLAQAPGTVTKSYGVAYNPGMGNAAPMVKSDITTRMLSRNRETTTESQHRRLPRISLGVNYEFLPRWSVGTGITYSSLRSDYTALSGTTETRTVRHLHYLGVPLNIQYRAWEWKGFSLYLSGGPMLESAVGANVETNSYVSGKLASEQSESISCKDWFWSLNAGAGLQFKITRKGALYVQPGLSWHMPGGDHIESSYTARPLSFEMDFGARWTF